MDLNDIARIRLTDRELGDGGTSLLKGEIPGASVFYRRIKKDESIGVPPVKSAVRIFFLCEGSAVFASGGKKFFYIDKAVFVPDLYETAEITATEDARILEINWIITEREAMEMESKKFPFAAKYLDALQYKDPFKSDKTISRAVIMQRLIPRFAMGSVETYGDDLIGQHSHPLLDQFFFSFSENKMELLIDDLSFVMEGDILLHIPLGSNHGVKVSGSQCAHYLWIDFITCPEGLDYLDANHIATGTQRSF